MTSVGILVLADTETHADLGRVANALETAKEFHEADDAVALIFDGAGTKWVGVCCPTQITDSIAPLQRCGRL